MMSLPVLALSRFFPHALSGVSGDVYAGLLAIVALGLIFAGRSIIKGLAFLAAGLAGAAFGLAVGGIVLGFIGAAVGAIVGFIVGGLIGVLLVEVGMGLALGYFGYLATHYLTGSLTFGVVVGIVLFFVGLAISNKLLELVTAAIGGLVLYDALIFFGADPLLAALVSLVLAVAGFYVQNEKRKKAEPWRQT